MISKRRLRYVRQLDWFATFHGSFESPVAGMIETNGLTKWYGGKATLEDLSMPIGKQVLCLGLAGAQSGNFQMNIFGDPDQYRLEATMPEGWNEDWRNGRIRGCPIADRERCPGIESHEPMLLSANCRWANGGEVGVPGFQVFTLTEQTVDVQVSASFSGKGRGRNVDRSTPPAQIRTGATNAYGSYLGYLASK
jgi:hypothetical protein